MNKNALLCFIIFTVPFAMCEIFQTSRQLPASHYQPQWKYQKSYLNPYQQLIPSYDPFYSQPTKVDIKNEDSDSLNRQFQQQWQIAIPNQQQGGLVWISAPQYGYYPQSPNPYPYPPSPPQPVGNPSSSNLYPNQNPPNGGQQTVLRDEIQTTPKQPQYNGFYSTGIPTVSEPVFTIETSSPYPVTFSSIPSYPSPQPSSSEKPPNLPASVLLKYCQKPRGQFPSNNCSTYINCWDDSAIEQSCPSGLVFNADKLYCDYPENTNCSSHNGSNSTESYPSTLPSTVTSSSPSNNNNNNSNNNYSSTLKPSNHKCPESYGTYRNTSNCAAFYVCVNGEPVGFFCPPGTAFNDSTKICDYIHLVDCKGRPIIEIPINSSDEDENSSENGNIVTQTSFPNSQSTNTYGVTEPSSSSSSFTSTLTVTPNVGYNFNLKKFPESVVNTGISCHQANIQRLTPDCSSVTICQNGITYIVYCAQATSFDAYSQKCVPTIRARC